jgi:predicted acetyltransferase
MIFFGNRPLLHFYKKIAKEESVKKEDEMKMISIRM